MIWILALAIQDPELTTANYERMRDGIWPTAEELRFRKIPWRVALWEARIEANREEKPILFRILGRATWDAARGRFTSFELVAVGRRTSARRDSGGAERTDGGMGVAFRMADPEHPSDRVAPTFYAAYGRR